MRKTIEKLAAQFCGYLERKRYQKRQEMIDAVIQERYPRPKERISQGFRDNVERGIYGDLLPNPDLPKNE